jgi:hypothetical protein
MYRGTSFWLDMLYTNQGVTFTFSNVGVNN